MANRVNQLYEFGPAGIDRAGPLPFRLDPAELLLMREGVPVPLERKVFETLILLVENEGHLFEKDEIINAVWHEEYERGDAGDDSGLLRHITLIRSALGDSRTQPAYIETVTGVGYRFIGVVRDLAHIPDEACPWIGLEAFTEGKALFFRGRVDEIRRLAALIQKENFIALVGFSGVGKSSLLRAGLVPELRKRSVPGGGRPLLCVFRPGEFPIRNLAMQLLTVAKKNLDPGTINELAAQLLSDSGSLTNYVEQFIAAQDRLYLILDQFEEIFVSRADEQERQRFIDNILRALDSVGDRMAVAVTLRIEFLPKVAAYPALWQLVEKHIFTVRPMSREGLRQVIEEPAREVGLVLEPGLVEEILDDLSLDEPSEEHGALPLLSHAMSELFRHRDGAQLTLEGYRAIGGVRETIARHADTVLAKFSDEAERGMVRQILLRLVRAGEKEGEDIGRRLSLEDLCQPTVDQAAVERIVTKLADERLLITRERFETGQLRAEIAHDALIRHWPQLKKWVNEKRQALRTLDSLEEDAHKWSDENRDASYLYQGAKLENALKARPEVEELISSSGREFLQESESYAAREREVAQQQERRRRTQKFAVVVSLILGALAVGVLLKYREAARQRDRANSLKLAAEAKEQFPFDPERGLLLAIEAARRDPTAEAAAALRQALGGAYVKTVFRGHEEAVLNAYLSPDNQILVTSSFDHTARVWDVASGNLIRTLKGHQDGLNYAAFSPDGQQIVTASNDLTAMIWDARTGKQSVTLSGHQARVNNAVFSPDGAWVLTASGDKTARIWDAHTGQEVRPLVGHEEWLNSAVFNNDGSLIATASGDKTARVWDASTGQVKLTITDHKASVLGVAFSPDGQQLATASEDKTAQIWEVASGKNLVVLRGHTAGVTSVEFSPDGRWIATGSKDGTVRLWDARTYQFLLDLRGHRGGVNSVVFTRDGQYIFTASGDGTARRWELPTAQRSLLLRGHTDAVYSAVFSSDGKWILTASKDGTARIWDARTGQNLQTFSHPDAVEFASFNRDGTLIATACKDGTARIWERASGAMKTELKGHVGIVHMIVFSPDGSLAVSGGGDTNSIIWDVRSGRNLRTLSGHTKNVYSVAFSPDGKQVATASWDNTVRVWDVATGTQRRVWEVATGFVNSAVFSPDGQYVLAGCADQMARIWSLGDGELVTVLRGHEKWINYAEFSPNGELVVTASGDQTARVWDWERGRTVMQLFGHANTLTDATFSPDGKEIVTSSSDNTVQVFHCGICGADIQELLRMADERKTRELTPAERLRFVTTQ